MRVLSILWGFCLGGIGKCALSYNELNGYKDIELKTVCIVGKNWMCNLQKINEIKAHIIHINSRLDKTWVSKSLDVVNRFHPNLIFVHGFNGPVIACILKKLCLEKTDFVCSYHGYYHPTKFSKIPIGYLYNRFAEYIYRKHALSIMAVAKYCENQLVSHRISKDKIKTIHNGITNSYSSEKILKKNIGYTEKNFA